MSQHLICLPNPFVLPFGSRKELMQQNRDFPTQLHRIQSYPVGAVSNRTAYAQLETTSTKHGERKYLSVFTIHYNTGVCINLLLLYGYLSSLCNTLLNKKASNQPKHQHIQSMNLYFQNAMAMANASPRDVETTRLTTAPIRHCTK